MVGARDWSARAIACLACLWMAACSGRQAVEPKVLDAKSLGEFVAAKSPGFRILITFAGFDPPSVEALPVVVRAIADARLDRVSVAVLALDLLGPATVEGVKRGLASRLEGLPLSVEPLVWGNNRADQLDEALPLPEGGRISKDVPAVIVLGEDGGVVAVEREDMSADAIARLLGRARKGG